jgi:hypothetical protein
MLNLQDLEHGTMVLTTGIDFGTPREVCVLCFLFDFNNFEKSNPATEPHSSPQGCIVRARKGSG